MGLFMLASLLACVSGAGAPPAPHAPLFSPPSTSSVTYATRGTVFSHPELPMTVLEVTLPWEGNDWRLVESESEVWGQVHVGGTTSGSIWVGAMRPSRESESGAERPFDVRLESPTQGETRTLRIEPSTLESGDDATLERFVVARGAAWRLRAALAPDSLLSVWLARHQAIYGVEIADPMERWRRRGGRGESTSIFNVIGGRAAIRETLQMQNLEGMHEFASEPVIPLSEVEGVTVVSHPFEEMLARSGGRSEGESIPLADFAPIDRFFVSFARPQVLEGAIDGGAEFLHSLSSTFTKSALDYDLVNRYFARLGLTQEAARMFLQSGAITESAVILSDLFVIDGTEVTTILRVTDARRLLPVLSLLGIDNLRNGGIVTKDLPGGGSASWAHREDLIFISTHRGELERVLALESAGGEGSLGQSAEFRYMLKQLPREEATVGYAYFSDPFIRRMVGPAVKIGQRRRMIARAELETLSAGALLHRLDGGRRDASIAQLAALGYVPEGFTRRDYTVDSRGVARSKRYGTPGDLTTLERASFDRVHPSEVEAYEQYRENYSRFWRQFFDPIAVRLDAPAPGEIEVEVFILPLIDSSIYDALREIVTPAGGKKLPVPRLDPEPVALLSANIQEDAWEDWVDDFGPVVAQIGMSPELLRELEPTVHFAIEDGDPVLHVGSGDLLGVFGANTGRGLFGGGVEMFLVPLALSAFTRPCQVLIPLRDAERVVALLEEKSRSKIQRPDRDTTLDWVRVGDGNRWILTSEFGGMIQLRFGIAVEQGHLIVSNIPWLERAKIVGFDEEVLSGVGLRISPRSGEQQLAGLFTAAVEGERKAAHRSAVHLHPLLLLEEHGSIGDVETWHRDLLGFRPTQPRGGTWSWDGQDLESSKFGTQWRPRQPGHRRGDRDFGVLRVLDVMNVSAQLEGEGLRTQFRVKLREVQ